MALKHEAIIFFLQMALMLGVALSCGQIMRRIHQPAVIGELLGGILLGPTVLGLLAPTFHVWLFPTEGPVTSAREAVIRIGMLFFLFVAGLEVNLRELRGRGRSLLLTSTMGSIIPFLLGFGCVLLLPGLWGHAAQERLMPLALTIGTALCISALPVIARILLDLGLLRSELGIVVMATATLSDLIGWSLFAVILGSFLPSAPQQSLWGVLALVLGFAGLVLVLGRLFGTPLQRWARATLPWPSGFIGVISVLVLTAAALSEALGMHAIFGAFLVGVALGQGHDMKADNPVPEIMYQFAISFFAPLYFVSVGLRVDFVDNFDPLLVGMVLLIACVGKIGGAGLGAWLGGMSWREALAVGAGMNARGAMEIILAYIALDCKLIDQRIFVALVIMALTTSMLSGPILMRLLPRQAKG